MRIEALGIREPPRVTLRDEWTYHDERSRRDAHARYLIRLERLAPDRIRRRVEAHRLRKNHSRVGKGAEIVGGGAASTKDMVDFLVETTLDFGVLRKQIPCPRQRVGRRFMAGEEQRQRLVAHLLVRHPSAVALGILRRQQHREQIPACSPPRELRAPLGDETVDGRVQPRAGASESPRVG